jgi:hypothetical protein
MGMSHWPLMVGALALAGCGGGKRAEPSREPGRGTGGMMGHMDSTELPNLKGQALSTRMRAHADRVRRLIELHEKMMGK